jgi:hypothetical protein
MTTDTADLRPAIKVEADNARERVFRGIGGLLKCGTVPIF